MKTVFSNRHECAHAYEAGQERGRAGNLFFINSTIYSYGHHFAIAKRIEHGIYLFTYRDYSSSTGQHKNIVRNAISGQLIYCYNPEGSHSENFERWQQLAETAAAKLERAKKPEIYVLQLDSIKRQAKIYADYFEIAIPAELKKLTEIKNREELRAVTDSREQKRLEAEKQREQEQKEKFLNFEIDYCNSKKSYLRYNKETQRIETSQKVEIPKAIGIKFYNQYKAGKLQPGDSLLYYRIEHLTSTTIKIGCHLIDIKHFEETGEFLISI